MKSVLSSRVSKINVLMTLCTLGITTLSLPVIAAPQEVCVKTSAGDVACGTPVPKPDSNKNRNTRDETTQTEIDGNVTWELKSCIRGARNEVTCSLSLRTSQDQHYAVNLNKNTKLVDSSGNECYANRIRIGSRVSGSGISFEMAKDAHYSTTVSFTDVPASISQANLVQFDTYTYAKMKFRNVPIN